MMSLTFGLFTQVSGSGPLGPLVLETIAALGHRVAWSIQLNELKGQGHSLTLIKGHSDFNVKTCFSQKQLGDLEPKLIWKL